GGKVAAKVTACSQSSWGMRSEGCVRVWRQCANCAANWSSWWSPCNGVVLVMLASQSSGSCHTDDCRPAKIKFHARWSVADQVLQMLPARALGLVASTRGEHMQMGMVLAMTPVRMEDHDRATLEWLAFAGAVKIIQAWYPTAHEGPQHDRRALGEGGAEHC